jgi:hypothetical protein
MKMRVRIKRVPLGWKIEPISDKIKQEIIEHLAKNGVKSDGTNFIQSEDEFNHLADCVLNLTVAQLTDLDNGWPVVKNGVDEWDYWHGVVGYMSN